MERIVRYGIQGWIYIRRRCYRLEHRRAQRRLKHAWMRIENDVLSRASTQDRGYVLPEHHEAIKILKHFEDEIKDECALFLRD